MNNFFSQYLQGSCFEKPFSLNLNNQTSLYRWLYLNMWWTNEILFLKLSGGGLS